MDRTQVAHTSVATSPSEIRASIVEPRAPRLMCLVCAACAIFECGRTNVNNGLTSDGGGTGGSDAAGTALGAGGSGDSGGRTGGRGTDVNTHGCPELCPGPSVTCFRCDPLPAGSTEGCGAPKGCGSNVDDNSPLRYPEGCYVVFPSGAWPVSVEAVAKGTKLTRKLVVFNDTFSGTSVDVAWEMHAETADGAIADKGTTKLDIPLGSRTTTSIAVTTPASGSNAVLVNPLLHTIFLDGAPHGFAYALAYAPANATYC